MSSFRSSAIEALLASAEPLNVVSSLASSSECQARTLTDSRPSKRLPWK